MFNCTCTFSLRAFCAVQGRLLMIDCTFWFRRIVAKADAQTIKQKSNDTPVDCIVRLRFSLCCLLLVCYYSRCVHSKLVILNILMVLYFKGLKPTNLYEINRDHYLYSHGYKMLLYFYNLLKKLSLLIYSETDFH